MLGRLIQNERGRILKQRLVLEESLMSAVRLVELQDQLSENVKAVEQIESMAPSEDEIGSVIEVMEREARELGIILRIPTIREENEFDENGDLVEPTGNLRSIRIKVDARGEPVALMRFMHEMEYLPYLIGIVAFSFESKGSEVAEPVVVNAPTGGAPGDDSEPVRRKLAHLKMDVVLTTTISREGQ